MKVIAGDVGGTHARLAVFEENGILFQNSYPALDFPNFEQVFRQFLNDLEVPLPETACLAIAGVVKENRAETVNLPWIIDGNILEEHFGLKSVHLINDFEAAARGITVTSEDHLVQIGGTAPVPAAPKAVLGAGTGLGQAILVPCGDGYTVLPTEGGHSDFAPRNELQIGLFRFLAALYSHVSVERVLSGGGIVSVYTYLKERKAAPEDPLVAEEMERKDPPAVITEAALESGDRLSEVTLELFCSIYGAEAGNLALKCLARGGVYVAGGIAPKILPALEAGDFRAAFEDKGRLEKVLRKIPVYVVTDPWLGLRGAALTAQVRA